MPRATWTWTFDLPPSELWPVLADTNRFNEAMGLPPYVLEETPQPNGTVLRRGKGKAAGFTLEWEEKPYEWIEGRHFRQAREFTKGPFRRFGPVFDLEPDGKGGSKVSYALEYEPLTLTGRLFGARLAKQAGGVVEKRILEAVAFAKGERPTWFDIAPPELPEGARERAAALAAEIDRSPYGNGLGRQARRPRADRHGDRSWPSQAQEAGARSGSAAARRHRSLPRRHARGPAHHEMGPAVHQLPRRQAHGLGALRAAARRALSRPATSTTTATSRRTSSSPSRLRRRCGRWASAASASRARWPRRMSPSSSCWRQGEKRSVALDLPAGSYRLRTLHPGTFVDVEHPGGAFPGLRATAKGVEVTAPGAAGTIAFANDAGFELAALIEDRTWTREALTAPEVISLQAFRDLFAEATLRPGDEAGVSQVALLFSDLQGSTALYERVGDAAAFNMVREHFALLASIVRDHDGAVVKTIGDAVMASFGDPAHAVKAALAMQARIVDHDLVLKLGVHAGPSVVVTMNDRLDYFGSTVNMAARLQGQSAGGDIVLSRAVADDPAVQPLLAAVAAREESVPLKGFSRSDQLRSASAVAEFSPVRRRSRRTAWTGRRSAGRICCRARRAPPRRHAR